MEQAKKSRTLLRRALTASCNALRDAISDETEESPVRASAVIGQIEDKFERLVVLDERILQGLFESNAKDEEYEKEYMTAEEYRDNVLMARALFKDYLNKRKVSLENANVSGEDAANTAVDENKRIVSRNSDAGSSISRASSNESLVTVRSSSSPNPQNKCKRKFKLPKIELKQFSGEVKEWIGFWGQFSKIDRDDEIPDEDKFQYLVQATVPGSAARRLVESFPPSAENYHLAVEHLKNRFARDSLLIQFYTRELLGTVFGQVTGMKKGVGLHLLYDHLETQLRALGTLGVTKDKFADMLFPLVESCLPEDTWQAWERHCNSLAASTSHLERLPTDESLERLMAFLRSEVDSQQRRRLAKTLVPGASSKEEMPQRQRDTEKGKAASTASSLISTKDESNGQQDQRPKTTQVCQVKCVFCDKASHASAECFSAKKMSLEEKREMLKKKKRCFICFRGHFAERCRAQVRCLVCPKRHLTVMCPELPVHKDCKETARTEAKTPSKEENLFSRTQGQVLLQTLWIDVVSPTRVRRVRALIDSGSQRSYLSYECAKELNLKKVGDETLVHGLFGGVESPQIKHDLYEIQIQGIVEPYSTRISVLGQERICNLLPRLSDEQIITRLKERGIVLSDTLGGPSRIDLLIGADVLANILTDTSIQIEPSLTAVKTKLGWTILGKTTQSTLTAVMSTSFALQNLSITDLWDLETLGIKDPIEVKGKEIRQIEVQKNFDKSVKIDDSGRYVVCLPWKEGRPTLFGHKELAEKRLIAMSKRLINDGKLSEYGEVLSEWESEGIIEEVRSEDRPKEACYLPHRPVYKEGSTTKIRPVFDASAKVKGGVALNECLEKGPNLIELIPSVLNKFRFKPIGVIADIRRAFLQIAVAEDDRDYLRFLWWSDYDKGDIKIYRHCRVPFGVSSSPFLLSATLNHHFNNVENDLRDTATQLKGSFYVDNCVMSVEGVSELHKLIVEACRCLELAKFDLRGWVFTRQDEKGLPHSIKSLQDEFQVEVPVLGLYWNPTEDFLSCDLKGFKGIEYSMITKRELLSVVQRLFDPIGYMAPVTLVVKLLLQEAWKLKVTWDEPLPHEIRDKLEVWLGEVQTLRECKLDRHFFKKSPFPNEISLHMFCDASKLAYAAAVYIRAKCNDDIQVQLVQARSRVAPPKGATIPRLELMAAVIGARLLDSVIKSLELDNVQTYCWSDSTVVLSWIRGNGPWVPFVTNRVCQILGSTERAWWHYVPSENNPADLPSRGCSAPTLVETKWWEGPRWLSDNEDSWFPQPDEPTCDADEVNRERKKVTVAGLTMSEENDVVSQLTERISNYTKIIRSLAWVKRFCFNARNPRNRKHGELTHEELKAAEEFSWKTVQQMHYGGKADPLGRDFRTSIDEMGVVHVESRLTMERNRDFRCPVLLPSSHVLTHRLIEEYHRKNAHASASVLICLIRKRFWIPRARNTIRKVLSKCSICKRHKAKQATVAAAPLPRDRYTIKEAFEVSGVDLAGPLYLRGGAKVWVVLFTCAVYRAIHLELTCSLSTTAFLQALRRFIARRGRLTTLYCDNGSNFVGAANELQQLNWSEIERESCIHRIQWKFNPPASPWWGGWWERLVGVVKGLLRRNLGRACLTYEELLTLLCECEAVVNARPLTYVSDSLDDLVALTPSMFLQPLGSVEVTDLDACDENSLQKRARYLVSLKKRLQQRFHTEYLGKLMKWGSGGHSDIRVGDLVLVEQENRKRVEWPLGRVIENIPGRDGLPRVARVKLADRELTRPYQKLYPLEIPAREGEELFAENSKESCKTEDSQSNDPQIYCHTRSGRPVKKPIRLTL